MQASGDSVFMGAAVGRRAFLGAVAGACAVGASGLFAGCGTGPTSNSGANASPPSASGAGQEESPSSASVPASGQAFEQISATTFAFDTVVTITASCAQDTLDALVERCEYFESIFSRTRDDSDIGRINLAGGKPVQVAPETADIIAKALVYCAESEGRFDITIGAATSLWDFKEGVVPDPDELAEAVKHIDYTKVQLDGDVVTLLDPQAKLDLGGVAKGYIADDLCALLVQEGCDSGFVNLGGNVKTVGVKPDGSLWHVGVQDPNDVRDTVVAAVYAQPGGTSVVTSGLYERRFSQDGRDYWHILDPKTGYPAETDLASATIISDSSADGDGYATPLFLMGHDKALAWINAHEGLEGLVVDAEGAITQTDGCNAELL